MRKETCHFNVGIAFDRRHVYASRRSRMSLSLVPKSTCVAEMGRIK